MNFEKRCLRHVCMYLGRHVHSANVLQKYVFICVKIVAPVCVRDEGSVGSVAPP